MCNGHYLLTGIRESSLDSVYEVTREDKQCQELNKILTDSVFGGMPEKEALFTEAIWSEYSARMAELAYLKGLQDMYALSMDLSGRSTNELYKLITGEQ